MKKINQTFNSYYLEMFIEELKEEIIKLKQELRCEKNLKEAAVKTVKELERDLEHRDSFFSIMRDVLANEDIDNTELAAILYCVVHEECGDIGLSKKELEIAKKFWEREYA